MKDPSIMPTAAHRPPSTGEQQLLTAFGQDKLLIELGWAHWLDVQAPYATTPYTTRDVTARYARNGYDWDIHGTLYEPAREAKPGVGFVLFHGGAGSEKELLETPDGRPGLGAVLAAQGFRCLAITYPGHYPPGGAWTESVAERQPWYLLDRKLPIEEIRARNIRCTFNTILQGAGLLTDQHMAGYDLLSFGHSTGGPMSIDLHRFLTRSRIIGIVGWASGGPDGWALEWTDWTGARPPQVHPLELFARRDAPSFRAAGYEDERDLAPWGGAEEYMVWGDKWKSQMKTALCDNQHCAPIAYLKQYCELTGLPLEEYIDHLRDPDPNWLAKTGVLLLVGERDKNHWYWGEKIEHKQEVFIGKKFEMRTPWTKVVLLERYGHFGYVALHNEKIAYTWLHALEAGYFDFAK
ncbi:MAG TPA: alpha/beta fold hydrolase [Stellaceae bacterium]|nr:alpha/beta fold hydrolase [Stellaceae bacterium]